MIPGPLIWIFSMHVALCVFVLKESITLVAHPHEKQVPNDVHACMVYVYAVCTRGFLVSQSSAV